MRPPAAMRLISSAVFTNEPISRSLRVKAADNMLMNFKRLFTGIQYGNAVTIFLEPRDDGERAFFILRNERRDRLGFVVAPGLKLAGADGACRNRRIHQNACPAYHACTARDVALACGL